ncbi:reverse transcriptase, partial [Metarhizium majus ARSEF 297]
MADPPQGPIVVDTDSPAPPRRTTRPTKPSERIQDTLRTLESAAAKPLAKPASRAARGTSAEVDADAAGEGKKARSGGETGKVMLQKILELLGRMGGEMGELKVKISEQSDTISKQGELIRQLSAQIKESKEHFDHGIKQSQEEHRNTKEELGQVREQLEAIKAATSSLRSSPQPSYANVARTPPLSQPTDLPTLSSMHTTPSSFTDTLHCTVDTSRVEEGDRQKAQIGAIRQAIENEVREKEGHETWRCAAVVKDARNADRINVICRNETELQLVKEAAERTAVPGARVLRDQLYKVKVDNANRTAVVDGEGNILPGAEEALGAENNVKIAKISWLSKREAGKAYGSMVVYVTKGSDARRLLDNHYFDLAGESAKTNVFEERVGPVQCYRCQEIGHKRFACKKAEVCGRSLRVLQLNVRKQEPVQLSLMNDPDLKEYAALAISEPYTRKIDDNTYAHGGHEVADSEHALGATRYRGGTNTSAVGRSYGGGAAIGRARRHDGIGFRNRTGQHTNVILAGDFNCHDLLWGGGDVSAKRQGEAEPIINLINKHGLCSLLPRGTKTWQGRNAESTIDLVLATLELAEEMVECGIYPTKHGSDHRAIRTRVEDNLRPLPWTVNVQTQTDQLMKVVLEAIHELTPRVQPPPYAKRWWIKDLTRLRQNYTFWRNQARTQRRAGRSSTDLEARANNASKEYHDGIRKQKKAH